MLVLTDMRKFHNYVKNIYIQSIVKPSSLLDLASGKGGDLQKWNKNKNIVKVVGYDIHEPSIVEAIKRKKTMKIKKNIRFNVSDLSKNIVHCSEPFDVITSMFAFHYFFKSKKTLDTVLMSIDKCSKQGTLFIITLFNGNLVKNLEPSTGEYRLTIKDEDRRKKYGRSLEVYIKDSVLDKPEIEYIVDPVFLIQKLKSINFVLIENKNFSKFNSENLFNLSEPEQRLSYLNEVFVFKKVSQ